MAGNVMNSKKREGDSGKKGSARPGGYAKRGK